MLATKARPVRAGGYDGRSGTMGRGVSKLRSLGSVRAGDLVRT